MVESHSNHKSLVDMPRRPVSKGGEIAINLVVVVILIALVVSVALNPRFQWAIIGTYFFEQRILKGVVLTILLTVAVMAIAIVLGTIIAVVRMTNFVAARFAASVYIWVFRSIPMLVFLLVTYNLAALYPTMFGIDTNQLINPLTAALIALSIHQSAYVAELVRAGLLSVASGQSEAAAALGMTSGQTFFRIILPQALRVIIPPLGNEVISLLKATALVSVISLSDLLYSVQLIYAKNYQTIPLLIVACVWYIIITGVLSFGQHQLERRLSRSQLAPDTKKIEVMSDAS